MHYAVIGLGYGDEAKGITVARLTRHLGAKWNVKFSGGCQAAHNVITDDGRHHTFAQFGSGTFEGASTFITRDMMIEPFALVKEAIGLEAKGISEPLSRILIEGDSLVTTPYHWITNRWEEDQRREAGAPHGSTGRGIGMTALQHIEEPEASLRACYIGVEGYFSHKIAQHLKQIREWCLARGVPAKELPSVSSLVDRYTRLPEIQTTDADEWASNMNPEVPIVFEGSQGVLLDEDHGFHPYTTWSHTTDANVHSFLADMNRQGYDLGPVHVVGVTRSYMTRHGAGPFVTEDLSLPQIEKHNGVGRYQGMWRQGQQDLVALRYAVEACTRIDSLYVTHTDAPKEFLAQLCVAYMGGDNPFDIFDLRHLPVGALAERESQSEALSDVAPLSVPNDPSKPAELLSHLLNLPLAGKGWGPRPGQGSFESLVPQQLLLSLRAT